jgi:ribose 5-phosphate isomerase A
MNNSKELAKQAAAKAAIDFVQDGMLIGLGTGSTASYFIEALIQQRRNSNLKIEAVATSERSAEQAKAGGITVHPIGKITSIDLTIDGADEIDHKKRMIKGGGGALLREKIIASMSREMVVVIDQSKLVEQLGAFPLPVEVVPFAHHATLTKIQQKGFSGNFRLNAEDQLYVTDNGNYIVDIVYPNKIKTPEYDQAMLKTIPGVVETGFFFNLAGRVIVGYSDGEVEIIP